jgi:hypothetical protein
LAYDQRIDPRCLHGGEGRVEVTLIAGRHFSDLEPQGARRRLCVSQLSASRRVIRINKKSDDANLRH